MRNQSKTLWLGLEDYVLEHARQYGQRLSVFSGCIFASDDPVYRGVSIPRRFFKLSAWQQGSALAATDYVLDQTPSLGPILERPARTDTATPPLGPYRTFQVPIENIADATGCRWTNSSPRIGTRCSQQHASNSSGGPNCRPTPTSFLRQADRISRKAAPGRPRVRERGVRPHPANTTRPRLLHPRLVAAAEMLDEQLDRRNLSSECVIERIAGVASADRHLGVAGVERIDDETWGETPTERITAAQRVDTPGPHRVNARARVISKGASTSRIVNLS